MDLEAETIALVGDASGIPACIDEVAERFAQPPWDRQIKAARGEFDRLRGAVCDDEELFETHMAAFLEWYVLERPLDDEGEPPVLRTIRAGEAESEPTLRALAASHHSVFEVLDPELNGPPGLRLLDLLGGGIWRVDQEKPMAGLERGDLFEARLIPWGGRVRFGPVFCYHPREARESIHNLVRGAREQGQSRHDLVCTLAQMRLKHSRCHNIPVARIYASPTLGGRRPPSED